MIRTMSHERVGLITIDRPDRRNALDTEACRDLEAAVHKLAAGGDRCLVITGAGTAFCSGADLGGVYAEEFRTALYSMLAAICALPIPVIAHVNGPAIGAGTQLAIAADLRIASTTARFAVPTAKLGLAVDGWTIRRLALLAGGGPARVMLLGVDELSANAAVAFGLVQRLGSLDEALAWATQIAGLAPMTLAYSKAALECAFEPTFDDPLTASAFEEVWASTDFQEGQAASREKRPPRFQGR